jgi:His/Glu/Gln/Arg/opine family amino acid ABC transporter permease subunit
MSILSNASYVWLIGRALVTTLLLSGLVILLSNICGLLLVLAYRGGSPLVRRAIVFYSMFCRALPVLGLLFFVYYGLPTLGIYLEPFTAALAALTFASAAYNFEFLRAAFDGVPKGQAEAGAALGLSEFQIRWRILAPQAYATATPALFSNAIQMVKGSSLASLVAVDELSAATTTIIADTYRALETIGIISCLYVAIALVIAGLQVAAERLLFRWRRFDADRPATVSGRA